MARIRKFCAYRRLERPYTRFSKYKKKNFVRARPNMVIAKFETGSTKKAFGYEVELVALDTLQIRHNALESARMTANRALERTIGKENYHLKVRQYPHHILRENPLAAGAGADRLSTGMKMSFGKPISRAARVKKGKAVLSVRVNKSNLLVGIDAMSRAGKKLPDSYQVKHKKLKETIKQKKAAARKAKLAA